MQRKRIRIANIKGIYHIYIDNRNIVECFTDDELWKIIHILKNYTNNKMKYIKGMSKQIENCETVEQVINILSLEKK